MTIDLAANTFRLLTTGVFTSVAWAVMFLTVGRTLVRRPQVASNFGRRLFLGYLIIVLLQLVFIAADLWIEWHKPGCGTSCPFFFPPYSNYYLNQVIIHWTATFAFNAAVGLLGGLAFLAFSKATRGRIIDQLDVDWLTVGGMVAGWPNILVFYGLVFVMTVLVTVVRAVAEKSASIRMIITPALPVACAVVAIFGDTIARWLRLYEIGVTVL